jgi:hypothetical protein
MGFVMQLTAIIKISQFGVSHSSYVHFLAFVMLLYGSGEASGQFIQDTYVLFPVFVMLLYCYS